MVKKAEPRTRKKAPKVRGVVHIVEDRCKGCGYCIEFCPDAVLAESTQFNAKGYYPPCVKESAVCINCGMCTSICPEFAIYTTKAEGGAAEEDGTKDRTAMLPDLAM